MPIIELRNVCKEFKIFHSPKGLANAFKSLFARKHDIVKAVDGISFSIEKGEVVGYIGQNGAGKSTTIKMMSGILVPTRGELLVNGLIPHESRKENAGKIGVVFGQRSQLTWDLPMEDTFDLFRRMYKIEMSAYRRNVDLFVELLGMEDFLRRPVRQLSLGQKMRAELAIALLHDPEVLFLDEPTIGLDVLAKSRIRTFIRELSNEKQTTVILTTHDMVDIEQICERIIMIDKGRLLFDNSLAKFKDEYASKSHVKVQFITPPTEGDVLPRERRLKFLEGDVLTNTQIYEFSKREMAVKEALMFFVNNFDIKDITVEEPGIEKIVVGLYGEN